MLLRLGPQYLISDRSASGEPGRAWNQTGWGIPRWGPGRMRDLSGPLKPMPIGARYFCGDCYPLAEDHLVAQGHKFGATKTEYQEAVTAHFSENHPDLHYPINQTAIDAMELYKRKLLSAKRVEAQEKELAKLVREHPEIFKVTGGVDMSGFYRPVTRPRELPDFTEFDFPDADLADGSTEEIELDQLISIAARQGRRLLGVEIQNWDVEYRLEYQTAPDNADLEIASAIELNTRTGAHNLDDPENLWRQHFATIVANIEATAGTGTAISGDFSGSNDVPPGGVVYVAPRLFWRFANNMDRQVDTGDLFTRLATIDQFLTTFLMFELLEQYSGLFGLT